MYEIINWIICVFAIFCVLINAVYTAVYSYKVDIDTRSNLCDFVFMNFLVTFGCIMNSIYFKHIDILKLFLIILGDAVFCILLFCFSYDAVYKDYKDQIKQNSMNKTIKF